MSERFADAVVVAAGSSRRMGGRDKLWEPLGGRPVLAWTLDALARSRSVRRLIAVVPAARVPEVAAKPWFGACEAVVVAGGDRRQDSVAAGVARSDAQVVLVHDGARPLVSPALVDAVADATARRGAALPVWRVTETLKRLAGRVVDGGSVAETIDRSGLVAAQTPQGLRRDLLDDVVRSGAFAHAETYTDEAAVLEARGVTVATVPGEATNVKVTVPGDLELAQAIVTARSGGVRVGFGRDGHAFGPESGLALGGITIPDAPRLYGHSDGDAALHAIADALLGAAGLGDLGRLFPAGRSETRGIASTQLLREVATVLDGAGWAAASVDLTVIAGRPRLGGERLDTMRDRIAELLDLVPGAVSVKASTGNLEGPEGAGRAITAVAVATVLGR